jgi:hypothetical protein
MSENAHVWFDDESGPLVRPYTLTGGRTRPAGADLDLLTQVVAARTAENTTLSVEDREILEDCASRPLSIAEIAVDLDLPLAVAKVLVSDLLARRILIAGDWSPSVAYPDRQLLEVVLDGVRKL